MPPDSGRNLLFKRLDEAEARLERLALATPPVAKGPTTAGFVLEVFVRGHLLEHSSQLEALHA